MHCGHCFLSPPTSYSEGQDQAASVLSGGEDSDLEWAPASPKNKQHEDELNWSTNTCTPEKLFAKACLKCAIANRMIMLPCSSGNDTEQRKKKSLRGQRSEKGGGRVFMDICHVDPYLQNTTYNHKYYIFILHFTSRSVSHSCVFIARWSLSHAAATGHV